jgi:hypothetical protein
MAMTRDAAGQFLFVLDTGSSPPPANCPPRGSGDPSFAGCPSISVFTMQPGSGTLAGGSPFYVSKVPTGLSAITFPTPSGTTPSCASTTSEEFLYVTSTQDLLPPHNDNTVSMYCVDSSGNLSETANSPFATQVDPLSVLAVNTNPAGQNTGGIFVYVGSQPTASGALSIFQMDVNNALLLPVGTEPPSTGQKPVQMLVAPTNNFLYVVCEDSNEIYGYLINTTAGTLSALNPPNRSTGSQPVALAMHSSGKFLYTSNSNASNISGFTVSTTSGSMSTPITVTSPASPSGMAAR